MQQQCLFLQRFFNVNNVLIDFPKWTGGVTLQLKQHHPRPLKYISSPARMWWIPFWWWWFSPAWYPCQWPGWAGNPQQRGYDPARRTPTHTIQFSRVSVHVSAGDSGKNMDPACCTPAPFPSSAPLHGMTFPFLCEKNPLWAASNLTSRHFFFPKQWTCHVFCSILPSPSEVPV